MKRRGKRHRHLTVKVSSRLALVVGCVVTSVSHHASAVTVLDDGFEVATHPTGFRTVAIAPGSAYYGSGSPSAALTNDATFGSTALTVTATSGYQIISPLGGSISLATIGDTLTLSFRLRFTNTPTADASAFRFGIHSSAGTPVSSDNFGTTVADNDQGYYGLVGATTAPTTGATLFNEAGGTPPILAGGDRATITTNTAGPAISDMLAHTVSLTITRTSASVMSFSYVFDGGAAITATNSTNLRTSFDEIVFTNGFTTPALAQYNIDDVLLEASNFTPIPEPAAAGLAGIGLLVMLLRRRA